jgi:hypothetical protein
LKYCRASACSRLPKAVAHHAFAAEFDATKPVRFRGTVTKMLWVNPHAWIYMDVKKDDGTVEAWTIEAGAPNTLLRRGFTKESLQLRTRAPNPESRASGQLNLLRV